MKKISKLQRLINKCVARAIKLKLQDNPYCIFCGREAITAHHFIHQSRSNFLRCDSRNLISICARCHYKLHSSYESLMSGQLIKIYGQDWFDGLEVDSHIQIRSNLGYWRDILEKLQ